MTVCPRCSSLRTRGRVSRSGVAAAVEVGHEHRSGEPRRWPWLGPYVRQVHKQRGRRHQPRVGHRVIVVDAHTGAVENVRRCWHPENASWSGQCIGLLIRESRKRPAFGRQHNKAVATGGRGQACWSCQRRGGHRLAMVRRDRVHATQGADKRENLIRVLAATMWGASRAPTSC